MESTCGADTALNVRIILGNRLLTSIGGRYMTLVRCAAFAAVVLIMAGCDSGPPTAEISGNVTYDGKPIETGNISFYPRNGKGTTSGGVIVNGAYTAKSVSFGEMEVKINASKVVRKRKLYPNDPKSPEIDERFEFLPDKYHEKTTLMLDVKERVMKKDFDLKK
jgi:hypothetical protein